MGIHHYFILIDSNWKLEINAEKSVHVPFTHREEDAPGLSLQGVSIPSMTQVKYLGIMLDERLTWRLQLKSKRELLNSRLHLLRSILKSRFPLQNKIALITTPIQVVHLIYTW